MTGLRVGSTARADHRLYAVWYPARTQQARRDDLQLARCLQLRQLFGGTGCHAMTRYFPVRAQVPQEACTLAQFQRCHSGCRCGRSASTTRRQSSTTALS